MGIAEATCVFWSATTWGGAMIFLYLGFVYRTYDGPEACVKRASIFMLLWPLPCIAAWEMLLYLYGQ